MKSKPNALALVIINIMALTAFVHADVFNTNLSFGAKGTEVKKVQDFLISTGFLSGNSTDYFGNQTKKAIQAFQKSRNLPPTGTWFNLTRQKANLLSLSMGNGGSSATTTVPTLGSPRTTSGDKDSLLPVTKKDVVLTISNMQGGLIYYPENIIVCYSFKVCTRTFPAGTKLTLKAVPLPGYYFTQWSEANCRNSTDCTLTLSENMTVYPYFKVANQNKRTGHFVSPVSSSTYYVMLGKEDYNVPVYWVNDTGLDMSLKVDGLEYNISPEDPNSSSAQLPIDSDEGLPNNLRNDALGPVYFALTPGIHTLELTSGGQTLDTIKVQIECVPGSYYKFNTTCWQDGANRIFVFKKEGILVKSDVPGIACGYKFESCFGAFPSGTKVTLTATALPGHIFEGWYGGCSGQSSTCVVVADKEKGVGVK